MSKVFSIDSILGKLQNAKTKNPNNTTDIVSLLQQFRSFVSIRWFENFLDYDPISCLAEVWSLLLSLSGHDDTLVRLNSYSALGAIITTVCPIFPKISSSSFSKAVLEIEVSPNVSIAVISCFTYLVHFISPAEVDDFILNTPVLHHFSTDVSQFIKHLPHIIKLMRPLEKQFHQSLLRSLCISFGRQPNHSFVEAVTTLIEMNPNILINDIMEFVKVNSLTQTILAIGPDVLNNDEIYKAVEENKFLGDFLEVGIATLLSESPSLTDFERACSTLALIARNSSEYREKIAEAASKAKIPNHFRKFFYLLPVPIELLYPKEDDPSSLLVTKMKALPDYLKRNLGNEDANKQVIAILEKAPMFCKGDSFCAFCESIGGCFSYVFGVDNEKLAGIMKSALNVESMNWVQKEALVKLFASVDIDMCMRIIPNYHSIVIKTLFEFSLSPQDGLSNEAMKVIVKVITLETISIVVEGVKNSDLFSPDTAYKALKLLNGIIAEFNEANFNDIVSLISETISYHNTILICSEGFLFLSKFRKHKFSGELITSAADWLNAIYKSFAQKDLIMSFQFTQIDAPSFLSTTETDVVANILPSTNNAVPGIINTFDFLVSTDAVNLSHLQMFASQILKLFPKEVIEIGGELFDINTPEFVAFSQAVINIMHWNCSIETAAVCSKFLMNAPRMVIDGSIKAATSFMECNRVVSGDYLSKFYKLIAKYQPELADELLLKAKPRLDDVQKLLFDIKNDDLSYFTDFVVNHPFESLPIEDPDFLEALASIGPVFKGKIDDFSKLTEAHWKYIILNIEQFSGIEDYVNKNRYKISRFIRYAPKQKKVNVVIDENIPKLSSLTPEILTGKYTFNIPLLTNFFQFSTLKINPELLGKILHETIQNISQRGALDLCSFIIAYANKNKIEISEEDALSLLESGNSKVWRGLLRQLGGKISKAAHKKACEILKISESEPLFDKIAQTQECTLYDIAFYLDMRRQFEIALESKGTSNKGIAMITKCVQRFEVDPETLMFIGTYLIDNISGIAEKSKKVQRALRLMTIIFRRLRTIKGVIEKDNAKEFFKKVINTLLFLKVTDNASIHNEMALLVYESMNCIPPSQEIQDYLSAVDQDFNQTTPYAEPSFMLLALTGNSINRSTRTNLMLLAESNQQSEKIRSLRIALFCISKNAQPAAFSIFASFVIPLFRIVEANQRWPVPELTSVIIRKAHANPRFNEIRDTFQKPALITVLAPQEAPCIAAYSSVFGDVLQSLNPPQQVASDYAEKYPRYYPSHPQLMNIYKSYNAWLLRFAESEEDAGNIWLEAVNAHQKVFLASPCLSTARELADVISARFDATEAAFLLVGRFAMMPSSFFWTYLVIVLYLGRQDDEALKTLFDLAKDIASSLPAKERFDALKELSEGNVLKGALIASSC